MLTSLKLNMYQKLNDPAFLFKAQYALNPITVLGFLLLAPVLLAVWLLSILFAPIKWLLSILFTPVVWLLGKFAEFIGNVRRSVSNETYTDEDWLREIKRREYNKGYNDGQMMS